jgi:hypothetical protein
MHGWLKNRVKQFYKFYRRTKSEYKNYNYVKKTYGINNGIDVIQTF